MQNMPGRDEPSQNLPPQDIAHTFKAPQGSPYSDNEWKILVETPLKVGRAMIGASPSGVLGTTQQVRVLNNSLNTALLNQNVKTPLLREMGQTLKNVVDLSAAGQVQQIQEALLGHSIDPNIARSEALTCCQQAVALCAKASPQDANAYKELVYATARHVAEAAREGGFLKQLAGGPSISPVEQDLLNDLARTLGIQQAR